RPPPPGSGRRPGEPNAGELAHRAVVGAADPARVDADQRLGRVGLPGPRARPDPCEAADGDDYEQLASRGVHDDLLSWIGRRRRRRQRAPTATGRWSGMRVLRIPMLAIRIQTTVRKPMSAAVPQPLAA